MKIKMAWAIQSFSLCFLFNLALGALIFFIADRGLGALNEWVSPLIGVPALPDNLHMALDAFGTFIAQARRYMMPLLAALTLAITFLLWFSIFLAGARQIRRAGELPGLSVGPEAGTQGPKVPGE
jgi:hypothetical protein